MIAFVLSLLLVFSTGYATTWYVHPDSTLNSIQTGLDSCATNDTVLVEPDKIQPGIYYLKAEGVNVEKVIKLR
ncbi:hypothetical protein KAW96_10490 [candidate division WOR-3 bacterium]|nr:hypothetical protein [candidate division WOR-3 bacterium]